MRKAGLIAAGTVALVILALLLFDPLHWISTVPKKGETRRQETSQPPSVKPDSAYYKKTTDWRARTHGKMNHSSIAFRDVNRNGKYDVDDRPMMGVAFEMSGPDNTRVVRRSNQNGFGNFAMSVEKESAHIRKEGDYTFRALTPPGWIVTSSNGIQHTTIKRKPGTALGMVSTTPGVPVGFAQSLTIQGRVQMPADGTVTVVATSPSGEEIDVPLDDDGAFLIEAERGVWTIEVRGPSGATIERAVNVDKAPVLLSEVRFGQPEPADSSRRRMVNFDDLIITKSVREVPGEYGGLDWRNMVAAHYRNYGGRGYVNTTMSGEYVAYSSAGHPASVLSLSDKPFDFIGGYFGVAWPAAEGETLVLEGWRDGERVYRDEVELSALGPVYFRADYRDVTRLNLSTLHYWQFVTDDMTFGFRD